MSKSAWLSRCSVNAFLKVWSANQHASTRGRCSHPLQVSHRSHYSWKKKQPSLWFFVFLSHQGHPQVFSLSHILQVILYVIFLNQESLSFFLTCLYIFFPDFAVLPRTGVVQPQIQVLLPRNSMKDLRASENYPTYGGSCSLLPEYSTSVKDSNFNWRSTEIYWIS